jgi:hypothetical protein
MWCSKVLTSSKSERFATEVLAQKLERSRNLKKRLLALRYELGRFRELQAKTIGRGVAKCAEIIKHEILTCPCVL